MRYDLTDLAILTDAAETGSLTGAARRNHLVLGAASARIRLLEQRLGVELLERSPRGVQLTAAGEAFLRHARTILAAARLLDADIGQFAGGPRGRVRLLSNTNALTEFLPGVLGRFLATHPDINVLVEERLSHAVARGVLDGEAELGIIASTAELRGLETFPFARDRLVLVAPLGTVFGHAPVAFADVLDQPFIGLDEASAVATFLAEVAAKAGRRLRLRMRLRSFEAVCLMVEAGAGLAVVPGTAAARYAATMGIGVVELADPWSARDLRLCVRAGTTLAPLARLLLDALRGVVVPEPICQQTGGNAGTRSELPQLSPPPSSEAELKYGLDALISRPRLSSAIEPRGQACASRLATVSR